MQPRSLTLVVIKKWVNINIVFTTMLLQPFDTPYKGYGDVFMSCKVKCTTIDDLVLHNGSCNLIAIQNLSIQYNKSQYYRFLMLWPLKTHKPHQVLMLLFGLAQKDQNIHFEKWKDYVKNVDPSSSIWLLKFIFLIISMKRVRKGKEVESISISLGKW